MIIFIGQIVFAAMWSSLQSISLIHLLRYFNPLYNVTNARSSLVFKIFISYICLCVMLFSTAIRTFVGSQPAIMYIGFCIVMLTSMQCLLIKKPANVGSFSFYAILIGFNSIGTALLLWFTMVWYFLNISFLSI